jgi:hypothetical protein
MKRSLGLLLVLASFFLRVSVESYPLIPFHHSQA